MQLVTGLFGEREAAARLCLAYERSGPRPSLHRREDLVRPLKSLTPDSDFADDIEAAVRAPSP
jgi:hypothetical protein